MITFLEQPDFNTIIKKYRNKKTGFLVTWNSGLGFGEPELYKTYDEALKAVEDSQRTDMSNLLGTIYDTEEEVKIS